MHLTPRPAPLNSSYLDQQGDAFALNLSALHALHALQPHRHALVVVFREHDELGQHWTELVEGAKKLDWPTFFVRDVIRRDAREQENKLERVADRRNAYEVSLNATLVEQNGFRGVTALEMKDAAQGWDKALFFAARLAPAYERVVFMENDVLVPSLHALHQLALGAEGRDLLIRSELELDASTTKRRGNWRWVQLELPPPLFSSLAAAVVVSNRLISVVSDYAARNGKLDYLEMILGSLARHANLSVATSAALEGISDGSGQAPGCEALRAAPEMLWHPIKGAAQPALLEQCAREEAARALGV